VRKVKKLLAMHTKFCVDCAEEAKEGITTHQYTQVKTAKYVPASYMTKAAEIGSDPMSIALAPSDDNLRQRFMDLVADDCIRHGQYYIHEEKKKARIVYLRVKFDGN
jgi:hypothetical protein